jgi:Acetyltransferase (GNAT) domain
MAAAPVTAARVEKVVAPLGAPLARLESEYPAVGLEVEVGAFLLTLRDVVADDMAAVLNLHNIVFGSEADARWYAWKYGAAPNEGGGQAVGAWHGSDLIAYCGGLPRTLWQCGKSLRGLQMGDVMVHPVWRGILTRQGPFFHVTHRFHNSRLGATHSHSFQLGYGFPNLRHLRLGVVLGLVRDGGEIESLHWSALKIRDLHPSLFWRWQRLLPSDPHFDKAINAAWQTMQVQAPHLLLGQRDAAYIRWRFVDRPIPHSLRSEVTARYCFFELTRPWTTSGSGIAVLDLSSASAHWLDWVGPAKLMPLAATASRQEAARAGCTELVAWASPFVSRQLANSGIARREVCAGLGISAASVLEAQEVQGLPWWLMGGDTDFL